MINLNKYTCISLCVLYCCFGVINNNNKTKPKLTCKYKNCSHVCTYHCAQLSYTIQHKTVLIILPPNFQTIITAATE